MVADTKLVVSLPVQLGMNVDGYYFDSSGTEEFLGYVSAGIAVSTALPVPSEYGSWFATASLRYLHLAADNLEAINGSQQEELIGKAGIGFVY